MRQDLRSPNIDRGRIRDDEPVEQHPLPPCWNVRVGVIERDERLQLQSRGKGCGRGEHHLASNGDPTGEPGCGGAVRGWCEAMDPVILS